MQRLEELTNNIVQWGKERKINDPMNQYLKFIEEAGETARAILKNDTQGIKDGIGDMFVVAVIYNNITSNKDVNFTHEEDMYNHSSTYFSLLIWGLGYYEPSSLVAYLGSLAKLHGFTLLECVEAAWNEIKGRQGVTVDGVFLKNPQKS